MSGPTPRWGPDVAARHCDLPGLGLLLDPSRLAGALTTSQPGPGAARVDRMRLKPGASVRAVVRPQASTAGSPGLGGGRGPWSVVHAFSASTWAAKSANDVDAARRAGLPVAVLDDLLVVVLPASGDRRVRGLARLRPDTGDVVLLPAALRAAAVVLGGPTCGRTTTLSHNPGRRWVGRLDPVALDPVALDPVAPDGGDPRAAPLLLRLHADRPAQVLPWLPGRPWTPSDGVAGVREALARSAHDAGTAPGDGADDRVGQRLCDPVPGLRPAARALAVLDDGWGARAVAVARAAAAGLAAADLQPVPAHGDLSPDQVVVDAAGDAHVLDWDRAGRWPRGWDDASWTVAQVAQARDGSAVPLGLHAAGPAPALVAAAALLRSPEPFRRQRAGWPAAVEALLALAERELGLAGTGERS